MKLIPERENVLYMAVGPGTVGRPEGAPLPHPVPVYPGPPHASLSLLIMPEKDYESPYPPPLGGWLGSGPRGRGNGGGSCL